MKQRKGLKIQISGVMGSGKTTNSEYLLNEIKNSIKISFADPIYDVVSWWETYHSVYTNEEVLDRNLPDMLLANLLMDILEDYSLVLKAKQDLLDLFLQEQFKYAKWNFKDKVHRKLLQDVGDVLRAVDGNCIINNFVKRANKLADEGKTVICDDSRYRKEVIALSENGFVSIRLNISREVQIQRILENYGEVNYERLNHPTETDLDGYEDFDFIIDAEKPIEEIQNLLDAIVYKLSLTASNKKWITRGLNLAKEVSTWSTCLSRQVGAVIMNKDNVVISTGYNGAPRGTKNSLELGFCTKRVEGEKLLGRPIKSGEMNHLCIASHAEANAISQCGVLAEDCTMYVTASPCYECSKTIANAMNVKIKTIIYRDGYPDKRGMEVLRNRGIKVFKYDEIM